MSRKKKNKEVEKEAVVEKPLDLPQDIKSMDDLSAGEKLPDVQEHSIAAMAAEKGEKIEKAKEAGFNPEIHATNEDGTPKKTQSGNFAKKRGRKSYLNTGQKSNKQEEEDLKAAKMKAENAQSAAVISAILEQAQMKFISEDFKYTDQERAANKAVWEATFEYYGGVNIPPPVALAVDHMTIILTRAQKPAVQDKFAHLKTWFKNKFKRKKKNALPDNRPDSERKDNVREEKSESPAKAGI